MKKNIKQGPPGRPGDTGLTGAPGRDGRSFQDIGRIYATSLTAVIDKRRYIWLGHYSGVLSSEENGLTVGDIRFIGGVLFVVSRVYRERWLGPKIVEWTIPGEITSHWLRQLKHEIFFS